MKYKIIASIIVLLAIFGTWYVTQGDHTEASKQSTGDQGINLN